MSQCNEESQTIGTMQEDPSKDGANSTVPDLKSVSFP
jgi:hypothetical protein